MKVLISGASGLIGEELQNHLQARGDQVVRLVRSEPKNNENAIFWNPEQSLIDSSAIEGFDVVINLSGENIARGRWSKKRKSLIRESRVQSTQLLSQTISTLKNPPKVFINASAIGIYGNCGDVLCSENTPVGKGFLAEVCRQWEAAAAPAVSAGIRTVFLRFGVVLSPKGGALGKMLIPFKLGLGGRLGTGSQYMSWIAIDDLLSIISFAIDRDTIKGPINVVSPQPVTNMEFTKALGKVLKRSSFCPVPAFALRLLLGEEMANEFLLSSTRVDPLRLIQAGYIFHYPNLEEALNHML